jgi:hypothetical protein
MKKTTYVALSFFVILYLLTDPWPTFIEQVTVAVTLWICIREVLLSNLGRDTGGFPQSLRTIAGVVFRLDQDRFSPNPIQFTSRPTILCYVAELLAASLNKQQTWPKFE